MKVLLLVSKIYNEAEFWGCLKILKKSGIKVDMCSLDRVISNFSGSERWNVNHFEEICAKEYEGLVTMSNMGAGLSAAYQMWHNEKIKELVLEFEDKPAASVCCAAPTIRYLAKGKRVSFYNLGVVYNLMVEAGAIPTGKSLTVDGNLVTAENEQVTQWWMESFVALVKGEEAPQFIKDQWNEIEKPRRMTNEQYERYKTLSKSDKNRVKQMRKLYPKTDVDEIFNKLGLT